MTGHIETLKTSDKEQFIVKKSSLDFLFNRQQNIPNGVIMLCLSGTAEIGVNFHCHRIEKGTQIFMLPYSILRVHSNSEDFQVIYFSFSDTMMHEVCYRIESEYLKFLKKNTFHFFSREIFEQKFAFLELMRSFYEDRENSFRLKIVTNFLQNYLLDIFDKISRHLTNEEIIEPSRKNELFKQFIRYVQMNYKNRREVTFYARKMFITPHYLSKIARDVDNRSAKEVIDSYVIEEIKRLLHSRDYSIQQIADKLHFPDQSYLGRFFKSKVGLSPSNYRKTIFMVPVPKPDPDFKK
ncbi:MAG: helix-turn-helix domain-containing protein [Bacteroidales bacterium]|nr:helix-turn-helix domain-containing protein [Bacteroidales bacterium]